jgi:signal peptidase II
MNLANRAFLVLPVAVTVIGLDQGTKKIAEVALKGEPAISYWGNLFRFEYAENTGAFLSLGANLPDWERYLLLTVFSSLILVGLGIYVFLAKEIKNADLCGYTLILGGGISNMIDRFLEGAVIDFMNMGIGSLRTGIFNVADMAIMAGLFVILGDHMLKKRQEKKAKTQTSKEAVA